MTRQWVENNLLTIILTGASLVLAYGIGTTKTTEALSSLTKRVEALERRVQSSADYHNCATRHLDRLENGIKGEAPCILGGM